MERKAKGLVLDRSALHALVEKGKKMRLTRPLAVSASTVHNAVDPKGALELCAVLGIEVHPFTKQDLEACRSAGTPAAPQLLAIRLSWDLLTDDDAFAARSRRLDIPVLMLEELR